METDKEIQDSNILIAEFMGRKFFAYKDNSSYKQEFDTYADCLKFIEDDKRVGYAPQIDWRSGLGEYHSSWDWLMPVVEKIESDHSVIIDIHREATVIKVYLTDIKEWGTTQWDANCKINHVYHAVIEYIKWRSNQK